MIFSQLALSFVLTAASTMAAGTAQFPKPPERKLSKNSKKVAWTPQSSVTGTDAIEGVYLYTNKCNHVFQATIDCGFFGDGDGGNDLDLCSFTEFKIGDPVTECDEDEVLAGTCVALDDGVFLKKNDKLPVDDESIIDPNTVCVFGGTFRASSAMDGPNTLNPIPLATSNGCPTTKTNFQTVVKGMMQEDGTLELDFSDDYGASYYTDDKPPNSYTGQKLDDEDVVRGRALAARGDNGRHLGWGNFFRFVKVKVIMVVIVVAQCLGVIDPTNRPTPPPIDPTNRPTPVPIDPTNGPTPVPIDPTNGPTPVPIEPTKQPTKQPTKEPTKRPTKSPTKRPTKQPTKSPTKRPSRSPTKRPSRRPTRPPSNLPSSQPSLSPSNSPSSQTTTADPTD